MIFRYLIKFQKLKHSISFICRKSNYKARKTNRKKTLRGKVTRTHPQTQFLFFINFTKQLSKYFQKWIQIPIVRLWNSFGRGKAIGWNLVQQISSTWELKYYTKLHPLADCNTFNWPWCRQAIGKHACQVDRNLSSTQHIIKNNKSQISQISIKFELFQGVSID